jgi:hypothetical protein
MRAFVPITPVKPRFRKVPYSAEETPPFISEDHKPANGRIVAKSIVCARLARQLGGATTSRRRGSELTREADLKRTRIRWSAFAPSRASWNWECSMLIRLGYKRMESSLMLSHLATAALLFATAGSAQPVSRVILNEQVGPIDLYESMPIAVDTSGNLYFAAADWSTEVYRVDASGSASLFANLSAGDPHPYIHCRKSIGKCIGVRVLPSV